MLKTLRAGERWLAAFEDMTDMKTAFRFPPSAFLLCASGIGGENLIKEDHVMHSPWLALLPLGLEKMPTLKSFSCFR